MEGLAKATVDYQRQITEGVHLVSHGSDAGLFVEFYMKSIKMEFDSTKAGRYIGKDVPFIRIRFPGNKLHAPDRPAKLEYNDGEDQSMPLDNRRFPQQWNAFIAQKEQAQVGTPLEEWAILNKSEVLEMKSLHIHTVEQLAMAPDTALTWLGAREIRKKAMAFLAQAKDGEEINRLIAKNETLENDIAFLKEQMRAAGIKTEREAGAEVSVLPAKSKRKYTKQPKGE